MASLAIHSGTTLMLAASILTFAPPATAQAAQSRKASAVTLKVGDPAPAFVPGTWLKGAPLASLAKGRIYVLEFWGTTCGACIVAIPHVTELAKKYADKVTFIGVNVLERGKSPAEIDKKVAAFVKAKGDTMDYLVCRDTADGRMAKTWLAAAGDRGIPATFIVDASGRLIWKGHPVDMEPVIERLVAGRFDSSGTDAALKANGEILGAIRKAIQAKDWKKASGLIERYKPLEKDDQMWASLYSFQVLLHLDEKAAEAMYNRATADKTEDAEIFAGVVALEEGISPAWYPKVIPVLSELAKNEVGYLGSLATVQSKAGDPAAAAKTKALELEDFKGKVSRILESHPEDGAKLQGHLAKLESELKALQAAAKSRQ